MKTILLLDLDGVLITSPSWKPDDRDSDGYSKFNPECVKYLNVLLDNGNFEVWLSSTRRIKKTLKEFNQIFELRKIQAPITNFLPICKECRSRKEEIERFIGKRDPHKFLILDDDKSLNSLDKTLKSRLVLTEFHSGFTADKLAQALDIVSNS